MNDENLVPHRIDSASKARELGHKGGIASGVSKRAKKDMAALARAVLEQPAGGKTRDVVRRLMPDADEGDLTLGAATVVAQVDQALKGSTRAFEALARVSGAGAQGPQDAQERPFTADSPCCWPTPTCATTGPCAGVWAATTSPREGAPRPSPAGRRLRLWAA